jgi:hypothetical protein
MSKNIQTIVINFRDGNGSGEGAKKKRVKMGLKAI